MASGYDKFFKEAQKAKGLTKGTKPQFQIKKETGPTSRSGSPEDRLRKELTMKLRQKQSRVMRKKAKFPLGPAVVAAVALVACTFAYYRSDKIDDWLGKVEIGFLGSAHADEIPVKAGAKPGAKSLGNEAKSAASSADKQEKAAQTKTGETAQETLNTKGWTPEEMSFFSKLNERKKELDLREGELGKLEEELQKRKSELDDKIKQLETMRMEISKTLKSRVAEDQSKVDKLVQFYSSMKPQQAAKVIETLTEDLAVEVLDKMKKKNAAEILDTMSAKKARRLSELLTGYERSTASVDTSAQEAGADTDAKDDGAAKKKK
jgi:flagellar motility protein MotE (MotC chaperone)